MPWEAWAEVLAAWAVRVVLGEGMGMPGSSMGAEGVPEMPDGSDADGDEADDSGNGTGMMDGETTEERPALSDGMDGSANGGQDGGQQSGANGDQQGSMMDGTAPSGMDGGRQQQDGSDGGSGRSGMAVGGMSDMDGNARPGSNGVDAGGNDSAGKDGNDADGDDARGGMTGNNVPDSRSNRGGYGGMGGGPGGNGGGMGGATVSDEVRELLLADADEYTWVATAIGSQSAAGYQLATEKAVMPIGGFNGTDPSPTLDQFKQYVKEGRIHYFIAGGQGGGVAGSPGAKSDESISTWVAENFESVEVDGVTLYDLTQPKAEDSE